jgi:hypothetical protein
MNIWLLHVKQERFFAIGLILFVSVSGCAKTTSIGTAGAYPEFDAKLKEINSIAVLSVRMEMSEMSAGGTIEPMGAWSDQAQRNIEAALSRELKQRPKFKARPVVAIAQPESFELNLQETRALLAVIESSIASDTSGLPDADKYKRFVYTLGPEVQDLAPGAQALLLIQGSERRTTAGRKAAQAGVFIVGLAGAVVGAPALVILPGTMAPTVSAVLVDTRDGRILWYQQVIQGSDLRETETTDAIIHELFSAFPIR